MTKAVIEKENRYYPRIQVNRPGRIRFANGPESNAQLIDISEAGATLFYSEPIPIGTNIELRFQLNIGTQVACLVYGEARHYYARGQSHVIGVKFTHFAPASAETIRKFIQQKLRADR